MFCVLERSEEAMSKWKIIGR